ncbi:ABC transporter substrate-binding protein [Aestuariivirga litoralis]|uniref:ABC transporter substrate-binding protein n=1 Tax=Aestuariivirga litoralis TaxID=2650924 RepID=UPI0018C7EBE1|nr:ABC transporter substrate-binding protein [Aestuariivirga litoralis]MBG1233568.1 ABC transporter substrate-binding protein [Aestuariivirga litoralis]
MTEFDHKLAAMSRAVGQGKLSRRDFMQVAMAAGLTVSASQALFSTAARAAPKKGGDFKFGCGHGQTTDSLDPATWSNGFTFHFGKSLFAAPLTQVDNKNNAVPHVAESFEPSDGAQKWVFKIRKGITYHDGRTLTAEDVVNTINYHISADSKSPAKSVLSSVTSVKTDGPDTVIFQLKGGNADFPFLLTDYHLGIYPSKDGKIDWEKGIGAGPYSIKNFEPGVRILGERNKNYFKDTYFDTVEMLSIVDVAARTNAYLSGEVHYINRADLKTIDQLKSAPDTELYNQAGFAHYTAPMHVDSAPFDKLEVRQAIKYAIDRQELVDKVLYGYGTPGNDNPISTSMKYAINPEPVYTYDPDKAKSLLKKAGLENLKVDLSASDAAFAGGVDSALLMAEQAKKAGIEINVVREPNDSYWDNVWLKKPWCLCYWGGRPVADMFLSVSLAADAAWNDTNWKNPRFNELLIAARAETDEKKRAAQYAEAQQLVHDDGGQVVLMYNNFVGAMSTKIGHNEFNSDFDDDGGYCWERWWMA